MSHTDEFDLASPVDVLISGTGLAQSLIAAACARAGRSTTHVDAVAAYGGHFGSFQCSAHHGSAFDAPVTSAHRVCAFGACVNASSGALTVDAYARLAGEASSSPPTTARGYSIDLAGPRVLLGADEFVETLVRSHAHKYVEFKAVEKTYVIRGGRAEPTASHRSDVFKDNTLSGQEKRALMRFLKLAHMDAMRDAAQRRRSGRNGEETNVAVGAPGSEWGADGASTATDDFASAGGDGLKIESNERMDAFLLRHGLSERLRTHVMYALALQTRADCDAARAMDDLKVYILSVAKYGPQTGACLIPVYGAGDIPQAFCRVAAVQGATYVLRQGLRDVDMDAKRVASVRTVGGQDIRVEAVFLPAPAPANGKISVHAVCVIDASLVAEHEEVLIVFPPGSVREDSKVAARALQIGSRTGCCPSGRFILHVSHVIDQGEDASDVYRDLRTIVSALVDRRVEDVEAAATPSAFGPEATKPTALWGMMYSQPCGSIDDVRDMRAPDNVAYCVDFPDDSATYRGALRTAAEAYAKLFGGEMFPEANKVGADEEEHSDEMGKE